MPWLHLTAVGVFVVLLLGSTGGPKPGPGLPERLATWPGFGRGPAADVAIANQHAFVAIEAGGLLVVDVSDPAHPVQVTTYPLQGVANLVRITGTHALVGCKVVVSHGGGCVWGTVTRGRLAILDIRDPVHPLLLATYATAGEIQSLCAEGNRVYLCDAVEGVHHLDISDPARPVALAVGQPEECMGATALSASGPRLYCLTSGQWNVVDITQPACPAFLTNFHSASSDFGMTLRGIWAGDDLVFVAEGDLGYSGSPDSGRLAVYGPGATGRLALKGKLELNEVALNVTVAGNTAYVAAGPAGVIAVDISNLAYPRRLGRCDTPGMATSVALLGTNAVVADYHRGLQILEVGNPSQLAIASSFDTGLTTRKLRISGDRAYLVGSDTHPSFLTGYEARSRLEIVDIKEPTQPGLLGTYELSKLVITLDASGDLVFLGCNSGDRSSSAEAQTLQVLDVSQPGQPVHLSETHVGTSAANLALRVSDHHVFLSSGSESGFQIFDSQNPAALLLLGQTNGFPPYEEVRSVGGLVYLAHDWGLDIFEATNPRAPQLVGSVRFEYSSNDDCDT